MIQTSGRSGGLPGIPLEGSGLDWLLAWHWLMLMGVAAAKQ